MKKYSTILVSICIAAFLLLLFYLVTSGETSKQQEAEVMPETTENQMIAPDGTVLKGPSGPPPSGVDPDAVNRDPLNSSTGPTEAPPAS